MIKLKINYSTWAFLILLPLLSCSDDETPPTDPPEKKYEWVVTHSISEFIDEFGNAEVTIDTIAIAGYVLSSDEEKNINNEIYIEDESGAVAITLTGDNLYQSYPQGTEVLLKCAGLYLDTNTRRITQAGGSAITLSDSLLISTGESKEISTIFFDINNIEDEDLNHYVRIFGFQMDESAVGQPFANQSELTIRPVTNSKEASFDLVFDSRSTFATEEIPSLAGTIYGILSKEDGQLRIKPISRENLEFTNKRRAPFEKRTFEWGDNTLPYQIMYPRDYDTSLEYPLVMFLHGAGERGTNNTSQMANGPSTFGSYDARTDYPAIVVFPQCPPDVMWSRRVKYTNEDGILIFEFPVDDEPNYAMEMAIELVRDLMANEAVDESRVYVSGLSMGGIGTLEFCYYAPDIPAAAISMVGGHDSTLVGSYAENIKFRFYHGANDTVVPARYSSQMNDKLIELGYSSEYFEDPDRGHEWNYVLNDPSYIEWMFSVSREDE